MAVRRFGGGRKLAGVPNDFEFFQRLEELGDDPAHPDLPELILESCPKCGKVDFWWNFFYDRKCQNCEPCPGHASRLMEAAAKAGGTIADRIASGVEPKTAAKKPAKKPAAKQAGKRNGGGRK